MAEWLQGRLLDEVAKNADDEQAGEVIALNAMSAMAEHVLMGLEVGFVRKAMRRVRNAELQWLLKLGHKWLGKFGEGSLDPSIIQKELWALQKELRVF